MHVLKYLFIILSSPITFVCSGKKDHKRAIPCIVLGIVCCWHWPEYREGHYCREHLCRVVIMLLISRAANDQSVFTITGLLLVERAYKGFHIKDTIKTLCLIGANPTCRDISDTDSEKLWRQPSNFKQYFQTKLCSKKMWQNWESAPLPSQSPC